MSIRSFFDIEVLRKNGDLTSAEEQLIADCQADEPTVLGDGGLPKKPSDDRKVRAELLRYLILGGCDKCQVGDQGVMLQGAWVEGDLNISFTSVRGGVFLRYCMLSDSFLAIQTCFRRIDFSNSIIKNFNASSSSISDGLIMESIVCHDEFLIVGSNVLGQCIFSDSLFEGGRFALTAQGAKFGEAVILERVNSKGKISFSGAEISGQFVLVDAHLEQGPKSNFDRELDHSFTAQGATLKGGVFFDGVTTDGQVNFSGTDIDGQLSFSRAVLKVPGGTALNAQRLRLKGGLIWRKVAGIEGQLDFTSAFLADLVDDYQSWEKIFDISLVGLTYENLLGPMDVDMRIAWLRKGAWFNGDFHPQPYQQLAKILRESGHRAEARQVLIAKEKDQKDAARRRLRGERRFRRDLRRLSADRTVANRKAANRTGSRVQYLAEKLVPLFNRRHGDAHRVSDPYELFLAQVDFRNQMLWVNAGALVRIAVSHAGDRPFFWLAGYGLSPLRSVWAMMVLIAALSGIAHFTWVAGDFVPKSDVVIVSKGWTEIANQPIGLAISAAEIWSSETGPGRDYETFNALAYAIDVVLPIVDLGQERAWSPSPARGWWGWGAFYAQKGFVLLGWVVAAIFAAAVTGLIRRDD